MLEVPYVHFICIYEQLDVLTLLDDTVGFVVGPAVGDGVGSAEGLFVGFWQVGVYYDSQRVEC